MKSLFFIFILCFLASFLTATIINIPADQPYIQGGINAAVNTDTILVQPGTYVESINFVGKNITVASLFLTTADTTYISSTIIDGNSIGTVVTFNNSEDSTAVLCGLTITNGFADNGGGIYCNNSSPSLQDVTISGNSASYSGGGIYCEYDSSPTIKKVTIANNTAEYFAGGIYCSNNSSPIIQDVTISGNTAFYDGGGIVCLHNSNLSLSVI